MVNKSDLIKETRLKCGENSETVARVFTALEQVIFENMTEGNEIKLFGLGRFYVKTLKAREGFNPLKQEKIALPERKVFAFKATPSVRNILKEKQAE